MKLLGRGGMGEVYEAVHEPLGRRVALKTIRDEVRGDSAILERFRREAETAASLDHPNIVKVTDFKSLPGEPAFFVMEHLEGKVLADVIEAERRLDPGRAAFIGMQILSGLAAAHRAGIVHRDIKPGNIFLLWTFAVNDLVKILDFGIAKLVVDVAATSRRALTDFGQILGTFAYMAPEQAMGGEVDARADIFAVGATLFHALSGVRPTEAMVPGHARVLLGAIAPWIDPRLAQVIDRAMERIPEMRFTTAEEMADALAPFAQDAEPAPGSMTVPDGPDMRRLMEARAAQPTVAAASVIATPSDEIQPVEPIPPTVAFGGTQPLAQPLRISQNPPAHSPSYPAPPQRASYPASAPAASAPVPPISAPVLSGAPLTHPRPASSSAWVAWLVVGSFVVAAMLAVAFWIFRVAVAAKPTKSAEQSWVSSAKLPACPAPESCVTRVEGQVTYPVCTKSAPLGTPNVGAFVLVTKGGQSFAGYVAGPPSDGTHYVVKEVVGESAADVTNADVALLCDPKAKRVHVD